MCNKFNSGSGGGGGGVCVCVWQLYRVLAIYGMRNVYPTAICEHGNCGDRKSLHGIFSHMTDVKSRKEVQNLKLRPGAQSSKMCKGTEQLTTCI